MEIVLAAVRWPRTGALRGVPAWNGEGKTLGASPWGKSFPQPDQNGVRALLDVAFESNHHTYIAYANTVLATDLNPTHES